MAGTKTAFSVRGGDGAEAGGDPVGSGGRGPMAGGAPTLAGTGGVVPLGGAADGASGGGGGADVPVGPLVCAAEQKACGDVCVDIDDPLYGCDPTSCDMWSCPNATGGTVVCKAGACVLDSCDSGSKVCSNTCVAVDDPTYGCGASTCDASSCPNPGTGGSVKCASAGCVIDTCADGFKKCGDKCVSIGDPNYGCGATTCDATSCPAPGAGTLTCQGDVCAIGACGAGTKKCGSSCVPTDGNNGCADAARCMACAKNEACSGTPSTCKCVPTSKMVACAGKCGQVSDGCGGIYDCGGCTSPQTCGGGNTANVCGCTPTTKTTACANKNCGTVPNGCGGNHDCGTCTSPQTCGGGSTANVCGCAPTAKTAACANKNCGTVPNGCGGSHDCGTCSPPQTCGGTGTANVCGCRTVSKSAACGSNICGNASDGCNGTYSCGICGGGTPVCVSGSCKECATINDCLSGFFACTAGACVCTPKSNANVLKNPGVDGSLVGWTLGGDSQGKYSANDVNNCIDSGSFSFGSIGDNAVSDCAPFPSGSAKYYFSFRFKSLPVGASGGGDCRLHFYQEATCATELGFTDEVLTPVSMGTTWVTGSTNGAPPAGTKGVKVTCAGFAGHGYYDQFYAANTPGTY